MAVADEHQKQQSSFSEDPVSVPTLLPEIIVEILSRLPVQSLLRCKSVCKLWCSLISDPHFVKSHLALSTTNSTYAHHRLIFSSTRRTTDVTSCPLYDVLYDKSVNELELDDQFKCSAYSCRIVGSCNGLLCIAIEDETLFIWNPSTRRLIRLPYSGYEARMEQNSQDLRRTRYFSFMAFGFGYDESTDDYKVVGISCVFKNGATDTEMKLYSLKTGNWKKLGDFPHGVPSDYCGKFLNGALHWSACGPNYLWTIGSLGLAKENHGEVSQPVYDEGDYDLTLGVLGEWLCVLSHYHGHRVDAWVMKVYGVKDSWTKLISIPYLAVPKMYLYVMPLCISKDGKVLLQLGSKLVAYDSKNCSSSEIQDSDGCVEACTFVESLISPDAPAGFGDNNNE